MHGGRVEAEVPDAQSRGKLYFDIFCLNIRQYQNLSEKWKSK